MKGFKSAHSRLGSISSSRLLQSRGVLVAKTRSPLNLSLDFRNVSEGRAEDHRLQDGSYGVNSSVV